MVYTYTDDNSTAKKSAKPNWREAFEQVLAKGCSVSRSATDCVFCVVGRGDNEHFTLKQCDVCPLHNHGIQGCAEYWNSLDSSLRRAIFRHVLAPTIVKDFTDVQEIRDRIADMLDDDAREKFLGKAENVEPEYYERNFDLPGEGFRKVPLCPPHDPTELRFYINPYPWRPNQVLAAFRDEDTRDRVLEFLNNER
jgi:hypothetical protein